MSRREYCSVYGCLNSTLIKPTLSLFKLPADFERRAEWLRLILREDLLHKPHRGYAVCEYHFAESDVIPGSRRKLLKKQSVPTLKLPMLQKKDQETQTKIVKQNSKCLQTEYPVSVITHTGTQTPAYLLANYPRKRKPQADFKDTSKIPKLPDVDTQSHNDQINTLLKLCDKFLTKELASLVKAQTSFKIIKEEISDD